MRRQVLLSGRGEEGALLGEQAVRDSGSDWTILRSTWFSQNFSEGFFLEQVLSGEVALPAGSVKEPFVDADDIADVAVAALTEDGHVGQLYELTGPRLLSFAEAVEEIGKAAGRRIRYVQVSMEQYASLLAKARGAGRLHVAHPVPVHRGPGRTQCASGRRRPARPGPGASGLRRLCAGRRCRRGLGRGPRRQDLGAHQRCPADHEGGVRPTCVRFHRPKASPQPALARRRP